jgi:predicted proteasome-type protease
LGGATETPSFTLRISLQGCFVWAAAVRTKNAGIERNSAAKTMKRFNPLGNKLLIFASVPIQSLSE